MSLDSYTEADLATSHNSSFETLLEVFCEILEDESIIPKPVEGQKMEITTILFIIKVLLVNAQAIEMQTADKRVTDSIMTISDIAINLVIICCLSQLA